jgi:ribonuclease P protein component
MHDYRFTKNHRLCSQHVFQHVYEQGKRVSSALIRIHYLHSGEAHPPRLGISVTRSVKHAVDRNKIKRRLREIVRLHQGEFKPGSAMVIVAKQGTETMDYQKLESVILEMMQRLGALKEKD